MGGRNATAVALTLLAVVYGATLLPGVGHSGDTAELQTCGRVLGVPHASGYPTYVVASHVFMRLLPWGPPAFRANLLSALFALATVAVLIAILRLLEVRGPAALAAALCLGVTPTFWRYAVVAEVYSLHLLFVALATLGFLRWERSGRERDLFWAAAVLLLAFSHHLMTATMVPAVVGLLLVRQPRVFLDAQRVMRLLLLVPLALLPYAYLLWRSHDPGTAYLGAVTRDIGSVLAYAAGRGYRGAMFAFTPGQVLTERVPLFLAEWWREFSVTACVAVLGAWRIGRWPVRVFFWLALGGALGAALNYGIPDIQAYFLPVYFFVAIALGLGLDVALDWRPRGLMIGLMALVPLGLAAAHGGDVVRERDRFTAERARQLVETRGDRSLFLASYHDFEFLTYLKLVEGREGFFAAYEIPQEAIVAYVREGRPFAIPQLRQRVPPGLTVFCLRGGQAGQLAEAGLVVEWLPDAGAYRITAPPGPGG